MIASTDEELREMAQKIGVQQRWHQGDHFDICLSKRDLAIKNGAIEITHHQLGAMALIKRRTGELPSPEEAYEQLKQIMRNQKTLTENAANPPPSSYSLG